MIQASELRIGNHINTPDGIGVVDGLTTYYKKPVISVAGDSYIQQSVSGIPLTEELLLKMGALKSGLITSYNSFGIFGENGEIIEVRYYSNGDWQLRIEGTIIGYVKYVHELQNVGHALCKKELTLS